VPPAEADPDKAKYRGQLAELASMGFTDVPKNIRLLKKNSGGLQQVVDELLKSS